MAEAYTIVLVDETLWKTERSRFTQIAQQAADQKFEKLAQDNMKGLVTRNPEPREMSHEELRKYMPYAVLDGLVGLYFTADIT